MSHYFYDDKAAIRFAEVLHGEPGVFPVGVDISDDHQRIDVTVALKDPFDWVLRNHIVDVAGQIADEYRTTILCFFRGVDEREALRQRYVSSEDYWWLTPARTRTQHPGIANTAGICQTTTEIRGNQ